MSEVKWEHSDNAAFMLTGFIRSNDPPGSDVRLMIMGADVAVFKTQPDGSFIITIDRRVARLSVKNESEDETVFKLERKPA